ncbi:hypothetical protein Are01nite_37520 [Actinoplanes regularis]|nr:hypothetical protein Are01nite_37520 [Actinoplanes regularis]
MSLRVSVGSRALAVSLPRNAFSSVASDTGQPLSAAAGLTAEVASLATGVAEASAVAAAVVGVAAAAVVGAAVVLVLEHPATAKAAAAAARTREVRAFTIWLLRR